MTGFDRSKAEKFIAEVCRSKSQLDVVGDPNADVNYWVSMYSHMAHEFSQLMTVAERLPCADLSAWQKHREEGFHNYMHHFARSSVIPPAVEPTDDEIDMMAMHGALRNTFGSLIPSDVELDLSDLATKDGINYALARRKEDFGGEQIEDDNSEEAKGSAKAEDSRADCS